MEEMIDRSCLVVRVIFVARSRGTIRKFVHLRTWKSDSNVNLRVLNDWSVGERTWVYAAVQGCIEREREKEGGRKEGEKQKGTHEPKNVTRYCVSFDLEARKSRRWTRGELFRSTSRRKILANHQASFNLLTRTRETLLSFVLALPIVLFPFQPNTPVTNINRHRAWKLHDLLSTNVKVNLPLTSIKLIFSCKIAPTYASQLSKCSYRVFKYEIQFQDENLAPIFFPTFFMHREHYLRGFQFVRGGRPTKPNSNAFYSCNYFFLRMRVWKRNVQTVSKCLVFPLVARGEGNNFKK